MKGIKSDSQINVRVLGEQGTAGDDSAIWEVSEETWKQLTAHPLFWGVKAVVQPSTAVVVAPAMTVVVVF